MKFHEELSKRGQHEKSEPRKHLPFNILLPMNSLSEHQSAMYNDIVFVRILQLKYSAYLHMMHNVIQYHFFLNKNSEEYRRVSSRAVKQSTYNKNNDVRIVV